MKVLWFTNTSCSAAEVLQSETHRGGWLKSLEQAVVQREEINLHIAFYTGMAIEPFRHHQTMFFPLQRKNTGSKTGRYLNKLSRKSSDDSAELQQVLQVIDQVKPDIIHVHGTEDNFGLLQYHTNIPVVVSIQGALVPYAHKFFAGVPAAIAARYEGWLSKLKLQSAGFMYRDMKRKAGRENRILHRSRHIIGRTHWDRRITRALAPNSQYYINNEILRAAFYTHQWNKTSFSETLRIVTISSDSLYKGFETIVQTAQALKAAGRQFEWQVIGLQAGSNLPAIVGKWLNADFAANHLRLLGNQSETDIIRILSEADVYCQVSHIENSPNSLCEALLLGMPVVATYAGGTSSLLQEGVEGLLVQDGDPYALAGALMEIAGDFQQARQFGINARKQSLQRHNPDRITTDLVQIYRTVTGKPITQPSQYGMIAE